ncbi:MSMEG_1061 family FMN-dependent PPOX-type flavoprotein [Telmatospirillum sp. J64-1]|uniref:MSMEG_1061 family FMN-dependent PPOX-type flavoprotein n=1 Tax=Telmatospirillum sp. J64-1 TaxID=2502183 RepID=UPI00115E3FD7|nr:MSMEG_1061 family FMN-dependent PPOX-type flavoprotein [Telmatospirillum sp. J64-1]
MNASDPNVVSTVEQLRELYDMPADMILKVKQPYLHEHAIHYIALAPFICFASGTDEGFDASPRGGTPGFVRVLDQKTIALPDWPGNNKLETMTNLLRNPRCGVLFMVPKLDSFLRINGVAELSRAPQLLSLFSENGKTPKLVIRISVAEVYFHCGKAFRRSGIWMPESWPDVSGFPKTGKIIQDIVKLPEETAAVIEDTYQHGLKTELY